jgi:5,6-dimethylbenzimidazole synthase
MAPAAAHRAPPATCETSLTDQFSQNDIDAVYRAIAARRDVRHFVPGAIDEALFARLLAAAHQAPSVGLMQPWRFIRIRSDAVREAIVALVDEERLATAEALGERGAAFMRLKVEGIRDCGELLVAALMERREEYVFGRRTLPEMDLASVACALQNMWLASRAEGLGMGWVSLFDPLKLAALLAIPAGAKPVAVICIGHVAQFYPIPMLEMEGWETRRALADLVYVDGWGSPSGAPLNAGADTR